MPCFTVVWASLPGLSRLIIELSFDEERSHPVYDYVIIGAGSAGCVIANRLTEDPKVSVLLLEAGGPDDKQEIHIPITWQRLFKTAYDWAYETEPEPQMNNRTMYWPRGKMLGGTSSMNCMMYVRGNRQDYNKWS